MLHRKILEPILARLDGERAGYFTNLVEKLEQDPRVEPEANLIYLVLKETITFLPTYLQSDQMISQLLEFVQNNRSELNKVLYSRDYLHDTELIRNVTNRFVSSVLASTLEDYEDGKIETGEQKIYRVSWPYTDIDFPFVDKDDDE